MNTGEIIRKHRLAKGFTQTQLGELVGVTESMICQLERGTKTLSVPLGKQIAQALEINPAVVFGLQPPADCSA